MQYTVNDLLKFCQAEIKKGNGNKHIVLSNDNEGNGYHGMFYGFSTIEDIGGSGDIYDSNYTKDEDTIVLG